MKQDLKKVIDQKLLLFFTKKRKATHTEMYRMIKSFTMQGGKRIRPQLMYYGYLAGKGKNKSAILEAACSLELIHSFLLIHDDIIDKDKTRRNADTIWYKYKKEKNNQHYGYSQAIVCGDLTSSWGLESLIKSNFSEKLKLKAIEQFVKMLNEVNYGQALDVRLQFSQRATEKNVLEIHKYKTAKYTIESPLLMGAILAGANGKLQKILSNYAVPVGVAFQIHDDILGMFGSTKQTGKAVGADLREGKKTLLIIKALENATQSDKKIIKKALGNKNLDYAQVKKVCAIIEKTGSLDYSQKLAQRLINKGKKALITKLVPANVRDYLDELADFIISRKN